MMGAPADPTYGGNGTGWLFSLALGVAVLGVPALLALLAHWKNIRAWWFRRWCDWSLRY